MENYQNSIETYPNTKLAGMLDEYIKLLEANGYKLTEEVGMYQTELRETLYESLE